MHFPKIGLPVIQDNHELKIQWTLLLTGIFCAAEGFMLAAFSYVQQQYLLTVFFLFVAIFGLLITSLRAYINRSALIIISHILLLIIIFICLISNQSPGMYNSVYLFLISLAAGNALIFRNGETYPGLIFPCATFLIYLFFLITGFSWENPAIRHAPWVESYLGPINAALASAALLLTTFIFRQECDDAADIKKDLIHALNSDQFSLHWQPQTDASGRYVGAEALLRWHHPLRGDVSPDIFIPIAEKYGVIFTLGWWVTDNVFQQVKCWECNPVLSRAPVSLNLSPLQFLEDEFSDKLLRRARKYGVNPELITLEITESTFIYNYESIREIINTLRSHGFRWAIDDFGAGYSSLRTLAELPIDYVKIDRSLIRHIEMNSALLMVVKSIIELSRDLRFNALAEGVENDAQLKILESAGCKLFQGYRFSRPLKASALEEWVERNTTIH